MSEEQKPKGLFSRQALKDQIAASKQKINALQVKIKNDQNSIQQELGMIGYASYILETFDLPDEKKSEPAVE